MSIAGLLRRLSALPAEAGLIPCGGAFTLKEGGVFIHSSRNPLEEARRFIGSCDASQNKTTIYILWGMGLGYHAQMLIEKGFTVIGIEPRPQCAKLLKKTFPIDRLYGFLTDDIPGQIFSVLASLAPEHAQSFVDLVMRGCGPSPSALEMEEKGKRAVRSSGQIYSHLMDSWYCHILSNLHACASCQTLSLPENVFAGQRVLICSAGPSLKESLPHIRRLRKGLIIIAVDTAFSALAEYGIIPDFLHAVDAKIHNIGDFAGIPDAVFRQTVLLADLTLSPLVFEKPWRAVEMLYTAHPIKHPKKGNHYQSITLLEHLRSRGLALSALQTGGSVATSAFHYAVGHGAACVYLAGQDLAYSRYRGHSAGTPYDCEYRCTAGRLNPIDNIHARKIPSDAFKVQGIQDSVWIDPLLGQFRSWFETSVADEDNKGLRERCINASEDGAYFKGWKHQKLSEIAEFSRAASFTLPQAAPRFYKNLLQEISGMLNGINPEGFNENILQREFLYKEYVSILKGLEPDPNLLNRKIRRLKRVLKKICGEA